LRPYLLDVNVLLALHWPGHDSHRTAMEWFEREGEKSFALCPITEAGFVRILTNVAFTGKKLEMLEAKEALARLGQVKGYRFWPMTRGFLEVVMPLERRLFSHRQVTDACLLGLAIERKGSLATLDHAVRHLGGSEFAQHITLIDG
jgi:toxin-antitoxin system PIN domain toxin